MTWKYDILEVDSIVVSWLMYIVAFLCSATYRWYTNTLYVKIYVDVSNDTCRHRRRLL